jgi:hypothetical protein
MLTIDKVFSAILSIVGLCENEYFFACVFVLCRKCLWCPPIPLPDLRRLCVTCLKKIYCRSWIELYAQRYNYLVFFPKTIKEYREQISVILSYNIRCIVSPKSQCISVVPKQERLEFKRKFLHLLNQTMKDTNTNWVSISSSYSKYWI